MQARKNNSILRKILMKGIKFITIWKNLTIILIVFAAIIVVAGLGMLLHKLFSRNGWLARRNATGGG